ncbi:DUF6756 family protein [Clostridium cellulovorans]|uniref:Uncharacterized protein n=1 Tax=Clostridium cellulovorans (strain ATCC 35296 / DSM 3052 / OCM 3 / 743B) TaxID=573061 RepID=D9SU54_CLOC7|nr:DUF6756 family protein [Clostridium cellulovorans]ADL50892.1 hypothetical protein Clocel_1136 [Clostridium cellulovorans 743B]
MWTIYEQIRVAIRELSIKVEELSKEETSNIVNSIIKKYAGNEESKVFLWEKLTCRESINDKDAWKWIDDFIDSDAIMFFDLDDEERSFFFSNGHDIVNVLGETYAFEFYITNNKFEYLICFNHHDYLICSGTAQNWIQGYIK